MPVPERGPRGGVDIQAGTNNRLNITAATVVKDNSGVIGTLSVVAAITGSVTVHDTKTTGTVAASNLIYSAATPAVGTVVKLDFPCRQGIVVTPGSAGTVVVSFS
jgi:hypothetical protein